MRTIEGIKVAKAKGKLKGKMPKLSAGQKAHLVKLYQEGANTTRELAEMFGVARSTVSGQWEERSTCVRRAG